MSLKKPIIIAAMAVIVVAVGMIFIISRNKNSSVENSLREASEYFEMLDYDKTIAIYNNILSSESGCSEAYVGLAEAYVVKGNIGKAIEILERGLIKADDDSKISQMLDELSLEYELAETEAWEAELIEDAAVTEPPQPEETTTVPEAVTTAPEEDQEEKVTEKTTEKTTKKTTEKTTQTTTAATTTAPKATAAAATWTTTVPVTTAATTTTTQKPKVEVPDFKGLNKDEAAALAKQSKIKLLTEYKDNDSYYNDVIYSQSVKAGKLVSEQSEVTVYVCRNNRSKENDAKVQELFSIAQEWGNSNTDKVKSVEMNEKTSTVIIRASSMTGLTVDESIFRALSGCNNAVLSIRSASIDISIRSSAVSKVGKIIISTRTYGDDSRAGFDLNLTGALSCTYDITLLSCEISSEDLENMSWYYENRSSLGKTSINSAGKPVVSVSKGGNYSVH